MVRQKQNERTAKEYETFKEKQRVSPAGADRDVQGVQLQDCSLAFFFLSFFSHT